MNQNQHRPGKLNLKPFNHGIRFVRHPIYGDHYLLTWTSMRQRWQHNTQEVRMQRHSDFAGAQKFAAKWNIEMPKVGA